MKFLIPSFRRPSAQYTVAYLNRIGIPPADILVSVQNPEDYAEYKAQTAGKCELIYRDSIGVAANRNQLLDTLAMGERAVMLDDNIRAIQRYSPLRKGGKKTGEQKDIEDAELLESELNRGFRACGTRDAKLFGVSPSGNLMFRHEEVRRYGVVQLNAEFLGRLLGIVKTDIRFDETLRINEDLDFLAQHIARGMNVIRLNTLHVKKRSDGKHEVGGCFEDHKQFGEETLRIVAARYPGILSISRTGNELRVNRALRNG